MNLYLIEPRDPLIVRDGRPFGPNPGARATSLPFPFPSTTTGGIRTRAGMNALGVFDTEPSNIKRVKEIDVRGPFLVEIGNDNVQWFAPAPADALFIKDAESGVINLKRLHPIPNSYSNIPDGMLLVGQTKGTSSLEKPYKEPPVHWHWSHFQTWLEHPNDVGDIEPKRYGIKALPAQVRMHVAIQADSQTGVDGALFQTSGREFTRKPENGNNLSVCGRLALAVLTDATIKDALAPLGGERRLMAWQKETTLIPTLPNGIKAGVLANKQCRLILMTPAHFKAGWKPTWVIDEAQKEYGVKLTLKAAAINRPQIVSGWDFEINKPKPTRRLAPAGSVYYFTIESGINKQIEDWLDEMWLHPISDDELSRKDGFGVAVVGNWHKEGKKDE